MEHTYSQHKLGKKVSANKKALLKENCKKDKICIERLVS
uniref:Uncharacterized protein n=1 Tax=Anguilla anguilla TaxID=7936 RepID=A0A0E9URH9_ANGAN